LDDNPALYEAAHCGLPVIPIYIWSPEEEGMWPPGAASRWWLHQSLQSLKEDLARLGSQLVIEKGPTPDRSGKADP
jgi:deoxyribodipyrimidine photo-lyase